MKLRDAMKIYGLDTEKEEVAENAASSSASFKRRSVAETLNNYRTFRAGDLRHRIESWQAQYDGLAQGYNNGTKSAEELKRAWSVLKPEGEKLSAELRSSGVFEEETVTELADTMDGIISSFSDVVAPKAAVTDAPKVTDISDSKYDIGYIGPLNGEEVDIEAEARKKAARALALGATGTEAEEAKAILDATSAPAFVEVGTHKIGNAGAVNDLQRKIENYTEQEYSRISKQIDSIDAQIKKLEEKRDENLFGFFGSVQSPTAKIRINEEIEELKKKRQSLGMERLSLDYDVDAPTSVRALLSEEENILTQKNGEKKIYEDNLKDNISHTAQTVNNLSYRIADTLDLAMDKANLDTSRAVANIQDFVKGKAEGFKNAVVSPSAPELKQYSVVSEENPGEEDTRPIEFLKNPSEYTRSMVDRFVQGENNYYRSGKTEGDKVENSILAQHTEAQRNAIERSNLENIIIDLAGTIGYQIPTMTLTAATGAAGLAANMMTVGTFGTAAYAEQKREAMKAGYTDAQAELLARSGFVIEGIGETLLGDAFGAVPMLGRKLGFSIMSHFQNPVVRTMLSFLAESGEEGLEEITQSVLSEASRSLITGEDFEIDLSEVVYGGLLGALSGGVMGSAGLGQRIENAKKVHAADVDYINSLSVNAEAVTSADEAREMIRALEKQRAALAHVEDSESGVGDAADRAAYMDSMIRKIEVMLSEKYSLSESITAESGFEKSKEGGILGGLKRTVSEDVRFQNTDDNAVIAIEARAEAVKNAEEAEQVINAIKGMRETNDVMRELVSSKAEIKNADRTNARLLEIENGLRERFGIESGDVRHSIGYTEENAPFVTVESDILAGVPETEWIRTVKNNLREKFPNGITVANSDITITGKTRREITGSNDTDRLSNHNPQIYADKMRSTDNTDEILRASQNYVNEAPLHPRKDDITSFGRGEVLIRVGSNDYSAEVVVGNKKDGGLVLYDIVNMSPTSINERRSSPKDNLQNAEPTANQSGRPVEEGHRRQFTASDGSISVDQYQPTDRAGSNASSDTIVSQDDPGVNSQYTQKGEYDSVAEEIEVENAARNYNMPRSERAIETYNSSIMAGATVDQRSIAIELGDVFGKRVLFFFDSDKEVNGYYDRRENAIYVNVNSERPTYSILASEMTHALEHTPEYSEIKKVALKQLQEKTNKTLSALRAEKRRTYEAREGRPLDNKYIDQELVEEYVGKFLYTDGKEIADFIRGTPRGAGRVRQWFNWLKKALARNNRIAKFIRKKLGNIQVLWADAVKRVKAEGHTPGEGVRHSIETDDKGRSLMLIDKNIFEGVPENKRGDTLERYIADNFGGTLVRSSEGYPAHITERTAGKMKYWNENMDEDMYFLKLQAGSQIDELFSISRRDRFSKNTKSKNAGFAKHGWDYFKSYFSDGENVYEADISSAKTDSGNVLYNIGFIREVGKYKKSRSLTGSPNGSIQSDSTTIRRDTITRTSAAQNGTSDTSISQDDPRVNSQYTQKSADDSSDVRHSYEDTEINERMRRDLETEGEKIEKERLERHYGKDPITMEEYKRRSKNGGFVSMADQAEAGEIEPAPKPGTAKAVGEAAAKEVFGENASPEKIKAESERLTSEAEAIKASAEIRTAEDAGTREVPKSNLLFSGSEEALRKSREKINETLSAAIDRYGMSEAEIKLAEEIAEGKKDVTHIPSGMNREHVSHVADIMITRNYLAGKNPETTALEKLGLRISAPLVADYRAAPALLGWERARREAKIAADKIEKRYQLSEEEKEIAHSIADGKTSEKSYNANEVNMKKISIAAEAYRVVKQFKENGVIEHRARTRDEFQAVLDTVVESPQMAPRVQNWKLTMNTMVRNNLDVFGNEVGVQVNNLLFRPIVRNEAERMRFVNRETGEFSSTFGKVSNLESQYIQMFIEAGIGIDEVANNDVKELVDKLLAAQKASQENVDDIQKSIEELADKETEGFTQYIEKKSRNKELRKAKKSLSKATQKYNALAEALENGLDIVRLANAADWFRAKYALYYDAINDFLVVHGYEPIGFIENYAPHMQEENMEKFSNVLQRLGFAENVFELPVEIAGRTENFKPGKKYNPHFQTRHGVTTRLDALAGFDSYVQHLSEVLYHTDDIQKLRQFNQSLRTALADETIQKMIDEKRAQMQRGEIDEVEGNDAIDKILDEYVKNTNLSPYVAILDEYTNVIAGKQVIGDRGTEKEFGRLSLNISNWMKKTFVRASIVGNISSAINQTVQLPLVTMECGEKNVALAFQDIMSGRLNSVMDFDKQSTFITGKQGIDLLTNPTFFNNLVEKGMVPFEYVDNLMAQVIVRAKFYQLVGTGVDYNTALVLADEYAESAVASRMKGAKPLFFHNKGIIKSLFSMFQLEIANGWAHISKDIPRELMNDAKSKGKGKGTAIWKGAVMAMHYWLLAFILNRILDELYGQTPVQFDFFGWVLNLFASGYGMTSNEFIKYVYKNGFKNLPDEFDGAEAAKSGTIEFLEDVPFVQTALAITGYGDSRLAMPKIEVDKIGHGIAGITSEDEDERKKGWAQLGDGIWSSVKSFLPFGNQINKTVQGIATVVKGGSYDYSGRLQYPVGNDLSNAVYNYPSYLFGKQAFNENAEFWAAGGQALSERATEAYEALLDSGMKFNEAFSLAKEMSALQADEKPEVEIDTTGMDPFEEMKALFFTDYSTEEDDDLQTKVEKQVELLNSVEGLTSDQKYIAFKYLCADDKVSQMMTRLAENGADPAEAYDVMSELAITKDTAEAPRARAEYLRESSLTGWEKSYVYYTSLASKSERETIEALRELNEGEPIIYETLDDLDIEDARGGDGTAERKRAIVMNSDLTDKGKYEMYSRLFVDNDESGVKEQTLMDELISAGVDAGEVATVFSGIKDGKTDAEKAQVLLDSKLTLLEIEKVYFEKIVTPSSREKKEEALESVIDAGGNVEVYLNAYIATASLSWENGDWKKGENLGKAKAYKKAIDGVTKDRRIRRALYDAFDVSEQVW